MQAICNPRRAHACPSAVQSVGHMVLARSPISVSAVTATPWKRQAVVSPSVIPSASMETVWHRRHVAVTWVTHPRALTWLICAAPAASSTVWMALARRPSSAVALRDLCPRSRVTPRSANQTVARVVSMDTALRPRLVSAPRHMRGASTDVAPSSTLQL